MMRIKKRYIILALIALAVGWKVWTWIQKSQSQKKSTVEVKAERSDIKVLITTTGTVEPQNRLEMKPPINGRVEEILVREGDMVKKGQVVALMSSTERAALLDAARAKDEDTLKYWQDAYKPTPLIAPIDGEVIVRSVEPGQTVTSADPVVVLSDRLIVKAQVDETDIGRVELGQKASVSLDAYPKDSFEAVVDHIAYESKLVNNVMIYEVDILSDPVPAIFRSGMSANVSIIQELHSGVVVIPSEAVRRNKKDVSVLVKSGRGAPQSRQVELGVSDGDKVEIISGLQEGETVVIEKSAALPKKSSAKNPFMPTPGGGNRNNR